MTLKHLMYFLIVSIIVLLTLDAALDAWDKECDMLEVRARQHQIQGGLNP